MIAAAPPPPARVQVVAREFTLTLSRATLPSGRAIVELVNFGEDAHDLRLQQSGGGAVYAWATDQPGGVEDKLVKLAPGRYVLWCSLAGHRALGMVATLRVVRRRS
ncbi:MAG: hypothetical protein JO073_11480 [Actinobacteria bacterium]|nr:hypothetical protein [Actinomycetota bacterium]